MMNGKNISQPNSPEDLDKRFDFFNLTLFIEALKHCFLCFKQNTSIFVIKAFKLFHIVF